jgi:hypothetical protein
MRLLKTHHSDTNPFSQTSYSFSNASKRKKEADEFKKVLDNLLSDQSEELEEFKLLLPKHGHFWDNGYEDIE